MTIRAVTMSDREDPWKAIVLPSGGGEISGRRVDPDLPWNIYWALDLERHCLLVLTLQRESCPEQKLPRLRGLDVKLHSNSEDGSYSLVLRLLDTQLRGLFFKLCLDVVSSLERASSEKEAVARFLARTWRWHRLLQSGRSGELSEEEQKGLIGELWVLQQILFPTIGVGSAIKAWRGPFEAPKDFEVGDVCIECKSHRGAATPFIEISSEHQLDTEGIGSLYLHVLKVAAATSESSKAVNLSEAVTSVVEQVTTKDPANLALLEERLVAAGFDAKHDYSESNWLVGPSQTYGVCEGFPRLTSKEVRGGVHRVRYRISLSDCEPFKVPLPELKRHLREDAR